MINPLNKIQIKNIKENINTSGQLIGRFITDKSSINICTGQLISGNVINQIVYWNYSEQFFNEVLTNLQKDNPEKNIKVIYSK